MKETERQGNREAKRHRGNEIQMQRDREARKQRRKRHRSNEIQRQRDTEAKIHKGKETERQ